MNRGQALLEYILLVLFVSLIGVELVKTMSDKTSVQFGNLGHLLSLNLTTGVCPRDCFFQRYLNGREN